MSNPIVIKRGLRIGDLDAETDTDLLSSCFVDNGELSLLLDVKKPESIVVGRTGAGKSALLMEISKRVHAYKTLDPNNISIRFLEASDIIQFFENLGVNLAPFYRLLWRHILTIELLKLRYPLRNEKESNDFFYRLLEKIKRDDAKKQALSYFREWGSKFWLETEQQIKEITEKISRDIEAGCGAELQGVDMSISGSKNLSKERRSEIVNRANQVVNQIQIGKLDSVLDLLEEKIFDDQQKKYFLLIDKLDEEWADTKTRYRFIRALIEEIKTFRKISNIKIVISIRRDLLDIVFNKTRGAGFQQEKYESYLVPIIWSRESLLKMIELRLNKVFKRQYTQENITPNDIFPTPRPSKGGGVMPLDYVLDRSLLRPRDVLQFINECFTSAIGSPRISWKAIASAEANYSEKRLNSLYEEWEGIYPALNITIDVIRGAPHTFKRSYLTEKIDAISGRLLEFKNNDPCGKIVFNYFDGTKGLSEFDVTVEILGCLFRVGAIGVKNSKQASYIWSGFNNAMLSSSAIKRIEKIKVHEMLYKALEIRVTEETGSL